MANFKKWALKHFWNGELPDVVGSGDYIIPSELFD